MSVGLDLRLLSQFLIIAAAPNMATAARKMGLSAPAVSQIVRRIERELGVTVFERNSRGIRLTPAGSLVQRRARDLLETESEILEALAPYRTQLLPKLRVHVASTVVNYIAPSVVSELQRMVGEIQFKSGRISPVAQDFLRGEFDILVSSDALSDIPNLDRYRLCRENLIALVPPTLPAEQRDLTWLSANLPMIRYEGNGTMDQTVGSYLTQQGLNPRRGIECRTPAPAIELIAQGMGWTLTTPFNIAYYQALKEKAAYMPLPKPVASRDIYLIANADRLLDVPRILAHACRAALDREVLSWRGNANAIMTGDVDVDLTEALELDHGSHKAFA